jgi:lambda repressor-like predicted transcriptional regulator
MLKTERLPDEECVYLRELSGAARSRRAAELASAGWSLAAIGDAFDPPKTRSTVKSWITRLTPTLDSPSSSDSSETLLATAESSRSVPLPGQSLPAPARPTAARDTGRRERRVFDPRSPIMTPDERRKIKELAPYARRYRARANPNGIFARANDELTAISLDLYSRGASVRELAQAAGVTYRAMARRLGRS